MLPPPDYETKRWKYVGYRGFCRFAASDNDFLILRRFGELGIRALLARQDELADLEAQLETLEISLMRSGAPDVDNGTFRDETSEIRANLLAEIDKKLRIYCEKSYTCTPASLRRRRAPTTSVITSPMPANLSISFPSSLDGLLASYSELRSRPKPRRKDIDSVSNWFFNQRDAISERETKYITQIGDLIPVVPKTVSPLRGLLERSSHFRLLGLWEKRSPDTGNVHYLSDARIDSFVHSIIIVVGLAMLIAPLWILAFVTGLTQRLGVITAFVIVFLPVVTFTWLGRPKPWPQGASGFCVIVSTLLESIR